MTITIKWTAPPPELREHVHFYNIMATRQNEKMEAVSQADLYPDYLFVNLKPATTYTFKVAACNEYTRQCGNWSAETNGTTLDGGIDLT